MYQAGCCAHVRALGGARLSSLLFTAQPYCWSLRMSPPPLSRKRAFWQCGGWWRWKYAAASVAVEG